MSDDTITLNAACHCRGFTATYKLPKSEFPLEGCLCSCSSCRHASGQLFATFAEIHLPDRPTSKTVKKYKFSDNLTVYFCGVCGASILNDTPGVWEFATGILSVPHPGASGDERREGKGKGIEGLVDRQCLFVGDTGDGGAVVWLPRDNTAGIEMKRLVGHKGGETLDPQAMQRDFVSKRPKQETGDQQNDRLHGECHCGKVRFFVTRPRPDGPPNGDSKLGKWWLADPKDPSCQKYRGSLDVSDSSRLVTGFEVNAWAAIPPTNIFVEDAAGGTPRHFDVRDPKLGLSHYYSSKGSLRAFCSTCGSAVLQFMEGAEVPIFGIGAGLFKGKDESVREPSKAEGVRCEDWIEWKGVEFAEDAMDAPFVKDIVARVGIAQH